MTTRKPTPTDATASASSARAAREIPRAGDLVGKLLLKLDHALSLTLPRVIKKADEEAIHDFRVEIRKIRTLLRAARPLYGRFHADAVRAAFTETHRATSVLRDEEVFLELMTKLDVRGKTFDAFMARRHARERALRRRVIALVGSPKMDRARALLESLVTLPVRPHKNKNLLKFAAKVAENANHAVHSKRNAKPEDDIALHDLRIAWKELRYACELLGEALPPEIMALAEPATKMQKRLGEVHDVDAALASITRARALPPLLRGQLTRALHARRTVLVDKYVAFAHPAPVVALLEPAALIEPQAIEVAKPVKRAKRATQSKPIKPSAASRS